MACHVLGVYHPPLPPEYQPYFDSGRRWADLMVDKVVLVEERMIDPARGFCGKPDLICALKGDAVTQTLVDWKTSQAYMAWWELQNAAYRHLAWTDRKIRTHRGISLRLMKTGKTALIGRGDYGASYKNAFSTFHGILNGYKFFYPEVA
jgi:hypothetical protein